MKASTLTTPAKKYGTPRLPKFQPQTHKAAAPPPAKIAAMPSAASTPASPVVIGEPMTALGPLFGHKSLTIKEAAYMLGKTEYAVRWWLRTGRLKGWQPGGVGCAVLVSEESVFQALSHTPRRRR